MIKNFEHIAVIPARAGSIGFPKKNQIFFDKTADFLDKISWLNDVVVTSNDKIVLDKARSRNYKSYHRSNSLSGPEISIKSVFQDLINSMFLNEDKIFWLFYIPILYKNISDFEKAKSIIERKNIQSLCSFIPAKSHPLNTWKFDEKKNKILKYIDNDIFRRQDLPPAWTHHHYICCFKTSFLEHLNNELINSDTFPFFISEKNSKNLIEVDTLQDFKNWKKTKIY